MKTYPFLACVFFSLLAPALRAENWPQFRGPTRQGVSAETKLPLEWDGKRNVVWKAAIPGDSWSSPIVWEDKVFLTTATNQGKDCHVICLERATGKVLWDKMVFEQKAGMKEPRNSYATPTPATDGQRVYAIFGDGSFVALNLDGSLAWVNRDFPFHGKHGLASCPVLHGDLLIHARDGSSDGPNPKLGWLQPWDQSHVLALDKNTGKKRWKTHRGMTRIAHATPNIWTAPDGRAQVISGAGDVLQGFDAQTGELLWTSANFGGGTVCSIVLADNVAFVSSGWWGRESTKAFKLGGRGDLQETNLLWEQRKGAPKIPSFVYVKPYLFTVDERGVASCLEGATGKIVWQERLGGNHDASPVAADGRIYFLSDQGETTVVAASPKFQLLARNPLGEKVQATMAVSGGRLFIRTERHLYCIGNKD